MGADIQAYKAAKAQWTVARDEWQKRLDYYNELLNRLKQPIQTSEVAPAVEGVAPQATNEMQLVSEQAPIDNTAMEVAQETQNMQPVQETVAESQGGENNEMVEPVGNSEQLTNNVKTEDVNQSEDNLEMVAEGENAPGNGGVLLSDEVDENGRQFVLNSNGNIVFGEIGEDSGLTPAPILLSEGLITNPATNDGYGLVHIEARHGDQIRNAGYKSVVEFVEEVAKNYEVIREGKDRNGHQTYMLQLTDKHNNTLMVELSGDGTYWNINTAGIFKTSYGKNRKEVYNRHTTAKQPTETVEASQDAEQSGTQATSSMNAPTTSSVSEDRNIVSNEQENTQKSDENAENGGEITETTANPTDSEPDSATPSNEDELDIYLAELKAQQERQKTIFPKLPKPSSFVEAYASNDTEAINKLDKQLDDALQMLVPMDITMVEATIKGMKDSKSIIKAGSANERKETPAYKAYDHIEKALAKRKKQLEKKLSEDEKRKVDIIKRGNRGEWHEIPQPKQENKPVESEPIKDEAPVTSEPAEQPETNEVANAGPVNVETLQLNMSDEDFNALLNGGDKTAISEYLAEMDGLLRIGVGSPLDGQEALREEYRKAVEQYGKENIPAEVMDDLNSRMQPYSDLSRAIFDRKYALQDKLREIEASEAQANEQAEKEAKAERKKTAFGGFLAGKTDLGAGSAEKALSKKYNFDGKVMTVAEFVEDAVGNGNVKLSAIEEPKYKGASRAAWNRMDARQQEADAKRVKESGTKTVYTVNDHDLGKTAYDYAKFLLDKKAEQEKADAKKAVEEDDDTLYREGDKISYDDAVLIAEEFVRTHKGAAKKVVISKGYEFVEQQMRNAGFSEVSIEAFKKNYAKGKRTTAAYYPDSDCIVIFKTGDKSSFMDSIWHENSHRVLDKYIKNPGLLKIRFDELPVKYKDIIIKLLEGNYEEYQYPEEAMCMFIGGLYKNTPYLKNGKYNITRDFITFEKEYRRFVDFAQNVIDNIYYGRETEFDGDGPSGINGRQGEWNSTHQRNSGRERDGGTNKERTEVVNREGEGSLAHEWWHALDNYFARRANVPMGMVTDSRSIDMRPELREAYNNLLKMIDKSDYYKRSKAKGDYWGRMHEVTARLMAEWVDQSLKDKGELNTFLSRGANTGMWKNMKYAFYRMRAMVRGVTPMSFEEFEKTPEALAGLPYPSKEEVKEFGDAMRNIFDTVQEQETEDGKVMFYNQVENSADILDNVEKELSLEQTNIQKDEKSILPERIVDRILRGYSRRGRGEQPTGEIADIARRYNEGRTIIADSPLLRDFLKLIKRLTYYEIDNYLLSQYKEDTVTSC